MNINLRKLAESNITFRFETDEDRAEFWELFIKNRGCTFNNHRSELLNYAKLWEDESGKLYIDNYKYIMGRELVSTWTEIKEKYMNDKEILKPTDYKQFAENIAKILTKSLNIIEENKIEVAKKLLQSNGYKVEPPYIPPTDSEIIARIVAENEKVGYVADWNNLEEGKFYIYFDNNLKDWDYDSKKVVEILGAPYTTQSIAKQIVEELNEKRFVRVD